MLTETDLAVVERHESKFVSFKILNDEGKLLQFDSPMKGARSNRFWHGDKQIHVEPYFHLIDPFRSHRTTSIFCSDSGNSCEARKLLCKKLQSSSDNKENIDFCLSFFVSPLEKWKKDDYIFASDPLDKYADLRSDIALILENANIQVVQHYHGSSANECIIGFRSPGFLKSAEDLVIAKYVIENVTKGYGYRANFAVPEKSLSKSNLSFYIEQKDNSKAPANTYSGSQFTVISTRILSAGETDKKETDVLRIDILTQKIFNPFLVISELLDYVPLNFV